MNKKLEDSDKSGENLGEVSKKSHSERENQLEAVLIENDSEGEIGVNTNIKTLPISSKFSIPMKKPYVLYWKVAILLTITKSVR